MLAQQSPEGLHEALAQSIRVGVVVSTNPDAATVRARFQDADGLISYDLRVLQHKTCKDKAYWMPDIGEHVLCLCLPHGHEQGFVVGAFYSQADATPVQSQDKRHVLFEDGTWLEYDRQEHKLTGCVEGDVELEVKKDCNITVRGELLKLRCDGHIEISAGQCITWHCDQHGTGTF